MPAGQTKRVQQCFSGSVIMDYYKELNGSSRRGSPNEHLKNSRIEIGLIVRPLVCINVFDILCAKFAAGIPPQTSTQGFRVHAFEDGRSIHEWIVPFVMIGIQARPHSHPEIRQTFTGVHQRVFQWQTVNDFIPTFPFASPNLQNCHYMFV